MHKCPYYIDDCPKCKAKPMPNQNKPAACNHSFCQECVDKLKVTAARSKAETAREIKEKVSKTAKRYEWWQGEC